MFTMPHYSTSRSQRNKGSNVKKILQVALLLGVVIWLLYQVKHSHDKKNEYEEKRIRMGDDDVFSGRKEKAGYERNVNLDNHDSHFDEIFKSEETNGGQPDDFEPEKDGENVFVKETEELQEGDVTNILNQEHEQEQIGYGDHTDSNINDGHEVNSEGTREDPEGALRLDSQRNGINFSDQSESTNGEDGSLEENEHQGDENVVQNSTFDKENSDNTEEGSVNDEVHEREGIDSQGSISSKSDIMGIDTAEDAKNIVSFSDEEGPASTNDENAQRDTDESRGDTTPNSETTEQLTMEAAKTNPRSVEEVTTASGLEQDDIAKPANNETAKGETVESQIDITSEDHTDTGSDNELSKLPFGNDQENLEMTTNSEVLDLKSVHSEGQNATIAEDVSNLKDDKVERTADGVTTAGEAVRSDVEKVGNNPPEETKTEESSVDGTSEVEKVGNNPPEETKTDESSVDGAANSSDKNEQIDASNDGELGGSQGNSVSVAASTTGGSEDIQIELKEENETSSNSGDNMPLLAGNANEDKGEEVSAE
ncbi:uncharacterized protein [Typha latifolia]|uniref:uncharacterized protein n=1 Tax=Typha latifolia TaxID=4733 RepID=UPI003C2DD1C8